MLFDYYVYLYLQIVFMTPARMIARNNAREEWLKSCAGKNRAEAL